METKKKTKKDKKVLRSVFLFAGVLAVAGVITFTNGFQKPLPTSVTEKTTDIKQELSTAGAALDACGATAYCGDDNIDVALGEERDEGVAGNGPCPKACSSGCLQNICSEPGVCNNVMEKDTCAPPETGASLCKSGTFTEPELNYSTGRYEWKCEGTLKHKGKFDNCSAKKVCNGECGAAEDSTQCVKPFADLCTPDSGMPTDPVLNVAKDRWIWTCPGIGGGTSDDCQSAPKCDAVCGDAPESGSGYCNAPKAESILCAYGTLEGTPYLSEDGEYWKWVCKGVNGGDNAKNCSIKRECQGYHEAQE